jgi:methyl-accepting chemotaxis protein
MKQTSLLVKTIVQITTGLTILLIILGYIGYQNTKDGLESSMRADTETLVGRLTSSLPISVWNFNTDIAGKAVEAEVKADFVNSIAVISNGTRFVSRAKAQDGSLTEAQSSPRLSAFELKAPLQFLENETLHEVGEVVVTFNEDRNCKALSEAFRLELIRIISLDLIAAILITLIIKSSVTSPIEKVRMAIEDIAQGNGNCTGFKRQNEAI